MPEEYFRLEYDAAKSDMIRYALLYHHGGIYMDADFLIRKDFRDLVVRLHKYDLVSYEVRGQSCDVHGSFSSNFMGGRKGSVVHKAVWEAQKRAVTTHCQPKEMRLERVCCLDNPKVLCHIPWTQLGEGISHRVLKDLRLKQRKKQIVMTNFCFKNEESFVPRDMGYVFDKHMSFHEATAYWKEKEDAQPFDRIAYHLFNSNSGISKMNYKQLFDANTVIGTLYTRSFSDEISDAPSSLQLLEAESRTGELTSRLAGALQPTVLASECGAVEGDGTADSVFSWCRNVAEALSAGEAADVAFFAFGRTGASAGASAGAAGGGGEGEGEGLWPAWLRRPEGARVVANDGIDSIPGHLARTSAGGTFVRMDVDGFEWKAFESLTDDALAKIDILQVQLYLCQLLPEASPATGRARADELQRRVQLLERLPRTFGVVARAPAQGALFRSSSRSLLCAGDEKDKSVAISFVNLERLRAVRAAKSELADRLERATLPTLTSEACEGLDKDASNGDGALHHWCLKVLQDGVDRKEELNLVGLSYGIATWDDWAKRLAESYVIQTELFDCFATTSNSGATPSLEGWKVPTKRHDVCVSGHEKLDGSRRFEPLAAQLHGRGPRGTLLKMDVEGAEWEALGAVENEELQKVDLFDLQIYLCGGPLASGGEERARGLRERVEVLERLARIFYVVARAPEKGSLFRGKEDADLCGGGTRYPDTISMSYVNRQRFAEV